MGGAQSSYTNKESEGERCVINGHHDTQVFQTLVDKFIEKYVLCQNCELPEIDMVVKKGLVVAGCKACGWSGELDNDHKCASYISKHPPDTGIGFDADKGGKKSRQERQAARAAKTGGTKHDDDDEDGDDDDEKPAKKEKKKKAKDDDDDEEGDEDGDEDGDEVKEKKEK